MIFFHFFHTDYAGIASTLWDLYVFHHAQVANRIRQNLRFHLLHGAVQIPAAYLRGY